MAAATADALPQAEAATGAQPTSPKQRKPSKKAAAAEKAAQEASAIKVQAAVRGAEGRRKSAAAKAEREEQVNAATKVQALHRGNSSRKNTGVVGKKGETSFSDSLAEYLTKISDWWKNDVVEGKTMTKVRGLPCLAVRSQDN